jgi:hypothetical protein
MNHDLFCSICVDTDQARDATASVVADLTGGSLVKGGVDCAWAHIAVDDDYGDFEVRQRDPDDFLGWPTLLEVMPPNHAQRDEVVRGVTALMNGLIGRGLRVLAKGEIADELPGAGEIAPASRAPPLSGSVP